MSETDAERARRRATRAGWAGRVIPLAQEGADDLTDTSTPGSRLGMMWRLALDSWTSAGRPLPSYTRADTPGKVIRRDE